MHRTPELGRAALENHLPSYHNVGVMKVTAHGGKSRQHGTTAPQRQPARHIHRLPHIFLGVTGMPLDHLSSTEAVVLQHVLKGDSDSSIIRDLGLSSTILENSFQQLFVKFHVCNRLELLLCAHYELSKQENRSASIP